MQHTIITDFTSLLLPAETELVLLDLDNTLYIYEPCHDAAILAAQQQLAAVNLLSDTDFSVQYEQAKKIVKRRIHGQGASHSRLLYFYELLHALGQTNTLELALHLESSYWSTYLQQMKLVPGVLNFLQRCKTSGVPIVIVTDLTTRIQFEKLLALGISEYITYVLTSEAIGVEKPHQDIFLAALEKYNVTAENAVMIGDDPEKDIKGAQQLGIEAILIAHETLSNTAPLR